MKLPVIRGHVGDWRYYTGVMKFKEIEEIVTPSVDEFCKEKEQLKDLFISATNFEGDTDSVWDKIMEIKKASSTNTSI